MASESMMKVNERKGNVEGGVENWRWIRKGKAELEMETRGGR